jgi:hypothetical protein
MRASKEAEIRCKALITEFALVGVWRRCCIASIGNLRIDNRSNSPSDSLIPSALLRERFAWGTVAYRGVPQIAPVADIRRQDRGTADRNTDGCPSTGAPADRPEHLATRPR